MRRITPAIFLGLCLLLGLTGFAARAVIALGTQDLLDWDETYYASTTATAAHGIGLYPYVLGYPRIHDMGGVGYIVYLFVLAYRIAGPHLIALRTVSLAASAAAIAGVWTLTRRIHGDAAGLAALALTPALMVFRLSNTIRMDVFAIAYVAWALVLYRQAVARRRTAWQLMAGVVFALGLEVHLHTAAAAFAVGCAYLIGWMMQRGDRRPAAKSLAAFLAGYAAGASLFVAVNILPDAHAFFRTAALARLSAVESGKNLNLTASLDSARLAQTFLSPAVIARKEIERYRTMAADMPPWEGMLWLVALPAYLIIRRGDGAYHPRLLLAAAAGGGGIVFNSASPLYWGAILPFFVPAIATLVASGFSRRSRLGWRDVSLPSVALIAALSAAILPGTLSRAASALKASRARSTASPPSVVSIVKRTAGPGCVLAGPSELYAAHFMTYPRFVGTRTVEVSIGSTYYDLQNDLVAYWREKRPDIVFGPRENGLDTYLAAEHYESVGEGVWKRPGILSPGCTITE